MFIEKKNLKLKKVFAFAMTVLMVFSLLASGCKKELEYEDRNLVRVISLKGPTSIGMVNLFDSNEKKNSLNRYEVDIVGAPDEISGKLINGQVDIAAVPTNLAAALYNKSKGEVQLLAVNTLGVLYILDKTNNINSVADLAGKTLYASGKASVPEYVLNHILKENGLVPGEDIDIVYKSEHTELMTLAATGKADILMLPQPFVASLMAKDASFKIALDLTKEWEDLNESSIGSSSDDEGSSGGAGAVENEGASISAGSLVMGVLVVRKDFAENNVQAVLDFLKEYQESVEKTESDPKTTASLMVKYDIMPDETLAEEVIPACNIVFYSGEDMKAKTRGVLEVFFNSEPKSIGGSIPDDNFYFISLK